MNKEKVKIGKPMTFYDNANGRNMFEGMDYYHATVEDEHGNVRHTTVKVRDGKCVECT